MLDLSDTRNKGTLFLSCRNPDFPKHCFFYLRLFPHQTPGWICIISLIFNIIFSDRACPHSPKMVLACAVSYGACPFCSWSSPFCNWVFKLGLCIYHLSLGRSHFSFNNWKTDYVSLQVLVKYLLRERINSISALSVTTLEYKLFISYVSYRGSIV